jgi:hypothetical protein
MDSKFSQYISQVSNWAKDTLHDKGNAFWNITEEVLADIHLLFLQPFLRDAVPGPKSAILQPRQWNEFSKSAPRFDFRLQATLGAVNWRGLYLENGRRTRLAPSGTLKRKYPSQQWHETLHHDYLGFAGRHVSINQVFLEWPVRKDQLPQSLSITFGASKSSILVDHGNGVQVTVSAELCKRLISAIERQTVLEGHKPSRRSHGDFAALIHLRESAESRIEEAIRFVLMREGGLFTQFREELVTGASSRDAITKFQDWMTSIFWLRLYCSQTFAGTSFYTARLPLTLTEETDYPDSSISIVSRGQLGDIRNSGALMLRMLKDNHQYGELKSFVREGFDTFVESRKAQPSQEDREYALWSLVDTHERDRALPTDFKKLAFICRLTQFLSGTKHEGHMLRFAFLLGFKHDQVLAQVNGAIEPYGTDLNWPDIEMEQSDGKAVAKWIEANALLLQRWDLALFFESFDETTSYPIAKRLVRVRRCVSGSLSPHSALWHGYPTNELELRKSLIRITAERKGTAAVLISERGAVLVLRGRPYLFHYHGEEGARRFVALVEGNKSFTESFEEILAHQLEELAGKKGEIWKKRAQQLRELAEALVVLGHGALIAIRVSNSIVPELPPLAPVWKLHETQSVDELSEDIMSFALGSALDGATEVIFPRGDKTHGAVMFRRYADKTFTPWKQDNNETIRQPGYRPSHISWGEMMTFGTRHRSALALSKSTSDVLVLTVSADGPVRLWRKGDRLADIRFKP